MMTAFPSLYWVLQAIFFIITHLCFKVLFLKSKLDLLKSPVKTYCKGYAVKNENVLSCRYKWKNLYFPEKNTVLKFLNSVSSYHCEIIITQFIVFKEM